MGIQKCKNCGTKFKYNTLLKPLLGVADPVHCSNCGSTHYITWISKFALPALLMLPVFFKNGIRGITPNISLSVLIYLIYIVIIKALSPYIVRYKLSENDIKEITMTNKKLNFYFFGETGEYDSYNPAYVLSKEYVSEMLYLIAENEPFTISKFIIAEFLNIKEETIENFINNLELINAIEIKNNGYRVKFPVFLEKDIIEMENYINNAGELIGRRIIEMKDILYKIVSELKCSKFHSYERILYHVICDIIFDGFAFEFFTEKNIFCASKQQPGGRDYIIIAYEDSELVEKHSNKILCSSNNYKSSGFIFNSFGDSNGSRKDMFRVLRLVQKSVDSASPFNKVNEAYNRVLDSKNKEIADECGNLICSIINKNIKYSQLSEKEKNILKFLNELEYIDINEIDNTISINVPVFYNYEISTVIKELADIILVNIFPLAREVFDNFEINSSKLTPTRHRVDIKETSNELWHQIFGATNEYLVKEGFVSSPQNIDGQGRYLRSLTVL